MTKRALSAELNTFAGIFSGVRRKQNHDEWIEFASFFTDDFSDEAGHILISVIDKQFSGLDEGGSQFSNGIVASLRAEALRQVWGHVERDLEGDNV